MTKREIAGSKGICILNRMGIDKLYSKEVAGFAYLSTVYKRGHFPTLSFILSRLLILANMID